MIIEINKNYTGKKDIRIILSNKDNVWNFKDPIYNLSDILKIEKQENIKDLNTVYSKIISILNIDNSDNIDLASLIGKKNILEQFANIKDMINYLKSIDLSYYENFLYKRNMLTSMISDVYYDNTVHDNTRYSHSSTVTGRSTIQSGLNFLTLKKSNRKKIRV